MSQYLFTLFNITNHWVLIKVNTSDLLIPDSCHSFGPLAVYFQWTLWVCHTLCMCFLLFAFKLEDKLAWKRLLSSFSMDAGILSTAKISVNQRKTDAPQTNAVSRQVNITHDSVYCCFTFHYGWMIVFFQREWQWHLQCFLKWQGMLFEKHW